MPVNHGLDNIKIVSRNKRLSNSRLGETSGGQSETPFGLCRAHDFFIMTIPGNPFCRASLLLTLVASLLYSLVKILFVSFYGPSSLLRRDVPLKELHAF